MFHPGHIQYCSASRSATCRALTSKLPTLLTQNRPKRQMLQLDIGRCGQPLPRDPLHLVIFISAANWDAWLDADPLTSHESIIQEAQDRDFVGLMVLATRKECRVVPLPMLLAALFTDRKGATPPCSGPLSVSIHHLLADYRAPKTCRDYMCGRSRSAEDPPMPDRAKHHALPTLPRLRVGPRRQVSTGRKVGPAGRESYVRKSNRDLCTLTPSPDPIPRVIGPSSIAPEHMDQRLRYHRRCILIWYRSIDLRERARALRAEP